MVLVAQGRQMPLGPLAFETRCVDLMAAQACHDPDPPSTDMTLIDGVMMGQGYVGIFYIRHITRPTPAKILQ